MNLSRNRTSLSLSLTLGLIGIGLARKEKPGGPSSSFPNLGFAHLAYAQLLSHLARHDEAFTEAKRARDLDPLSLIINTLYGAYLYAARQNDEAEAQLRRTIELAQIFGSYISS